MELINWDFTGAGELSNKLQSFERALRIYESKSQELVSDSMRIGIVVNRLGCFRNAAEYNGGGEVAESAAEWNDRRRLD